MSGKAWIMAGTAEAFHLRAETKIFSGFCLWKAALTFSALSLPLLTYGSVFDHKQTAALLQGF